MSYDLQAIPKDTDESWEQALTRAVASSADTQPLSAVQRATWDAVVEQLTNLSPDFERFDSDTFVELDIEEYGVQVTMYESDAGISAAYWHEGDSAVNVVALMGSIVGVIRDTTGWSVWDREAGR